MSVPVIGGISDDTVASIKIRTKVPRRHPRTSMVAFKNNERVAGDNSGNNGQDGR
jgi:hypothetical protein